jgi:hypothetical protein
MLTNSAPEGQQNLEALWANVQAKYRASRHYRAGNDPEYAKALAEFDRAANPPKASNIISFPGARK